MELRYCPQHERLYDGAARRWIPCMRGEVRLLLAIYPHEGHLAFREAVCDWCVGGGPWRWVRQGEA